MRTSRQTKIRRALLRALESLPGGYLLPDDLLRGEATRLVVPGPTTAEFDGEISAADTARLIVGLQAEETTKWKITDAGRLWLAENP